MQGRPAGITSRGPLLGWWVPFKDARLVPRWCGAAIVRVGEELGSGVAVAKFIEQRLWVVGVAVGGIIGVRVRRESTRFPGIYILMAVRWGFPKKAGPRRFGQALFCKVLMKVSKSSYWLRLVTKLLKSR